MLREENYDISGIRSDDSTDDESEPKRRIPAWAQGKIELSISVPCIVSFLSVRPSNFSLSSCQYSYNVISYIIVHYNRL